MRVGGKQSGNMEDVPEPHILPQLPTAVRSDLFLLSNPKHTQGTRCHMVNVCLHCEELLGAGTKVWVRGECGLGDTLNLRHK